MRISAVALGALLLSACAPTGFTVFVTSDAQPAIQSFFEFLPEANAHVVASADPKSAAAGNSGTGVRVGLVQDLSCGECYQLTGSNARYVVHGGSTIGLQYGLAELLESFNFRFFHPWAAKAPASLVLPDKSAALGPTFTPQMTLRGLHLHTLHPIEGHYAFWVPGASQLEDARRIDDWIVKNRGNYVEWCALNNIVPQSGQPVDQAWVSHTRAIIDDAHQRGMKVGIAVEMFGTANLQQAFVMLDTQTEADPKAEVDARLHLLLDGLPFDKVNLSFGEFSGSDPTVFIDSVNLIDQELKAIAPGTELDATIHLDNAAGLQVTYMGETLPYYFLVQFANPDIVPWIHSVMYFDLFQPADDAYGYTNFDQHLGYLQDRLKASQPVAYYPESAYWVDFDDSVPTYLPVYLRSRWLDMNQLQTQAQQGGYGGLKQHVEFSSGFEWGYWQNDYAVLRMNFGLPSSWQDEVQAMYSPWGATGQKLAAQIGALGELQSQTLIDGALATYLAGRDEVLDFGANEGTISQPPRPAFADVAKYSESDRASFQQTVLTPLANLLTQTQQIQTAVTNLKLDPKDPWLSEVSDGIAVDEARTRFIGALFEAAATFSAQGNDGGWLAKADAALTDAKVIIGRRDAHLHYPNASLLLDTTSNATIYQYGYLYEADQLCYWERERVQARAAILGETAMVPTCVL
jgi:hypothetical protein